MGTATKPELAPMPAESEGELPPSHLLLLEQNRLAVARVLNGMFRDKDVRLDDLVVVVVAALGGEIGAALARMFWGMDDLMAEMREAAKEGRVGAFVDAYAKDRAVEWLSVMMPSALAFTRDRPPGFVILMIIDDTDKAVALLARPVVPVRDSLN